MGGGEGRNGCGGGGEVMLFIAKATTTAAKPSFVQIPADPTTADDATATSQFRVVACRAKTPQNKGA